MLIVAIQQGFFYVYVDMIKQQKWGASTFWRHWRSFLNILTVAVKAIEGKQVGRVGTVACSVFCNTVDKLKWGSSYLSRENIAMLSIILTHSKSSRCAAFIVLMWSDQRHCVFPPDLGQQAPKLTGISIPVTIVSQTLKGESMPFSFLLRFCHTCAQLSAATLFFSW